jgi:hypothetical protein
MPPKIYLFDHNGKFVSWKNGVEAKERISFEDIIPAGDECCWICSLHRSKGACGCGPKDDCPCMSEPRDLDRQDALWIVHDSHERHCLGNIETLPKGEVPFPPRAVLFVVVRDGRLFPKESTKAQTMTLSGGPKGSSSCIPVFHLQGPLVSMYGTEFRKVLDQMLKALDDPPGENPLDRFHELAKSTPLGPEKKTWYERLGIVLRTVP